MAERVTVLFTGAGRRVELIQAFRAAHRALGLGGQTVAVDVDPLAPALRVADAFELVPASTDAGYIPRLLTLCAARNVNLIFPLIDDDVPVLAETGPLFRELGVQVGTMGLESARLVADKWATARLLQEAGVDGPQTWLPDEFPFASPPAFPLFVKPRFGSGSKHTARVDHEDELAVFLRRVPQPVIQEFLEGPEITCDVAYSLDGELLGMCQRRRIETREGEVQKGVTVWDEGIAESCRQIGKALRASGPIAIQCLFRDGRPCFTEINGRFGGGSPLAIAAGLDFPLWYLSLRAGRIVDLPQLGSYRRGLFITRHDESYFGTGLGDIAAEDSLVEEGPWRSQR